MIGLWLATTPPTSAPPATFVVSTPWISDGQYFIGGFFAALAIIVLAALVAPRLSSGGGD